MPCGLERDQCHTLRTGNSKTTWRLELFSKPFLLHRQHESKTSAGPSLSAYNGKVVAAHRSPSAAAYAAAAYAAAAYAAAACSQQGCHARQKNRSPDPGTGGS